MRQRTWMALVAGLVLPLAVACGNGDDDSNSTPAVGETPQATTEAMSTATATMPPASPTDEPATDTIELTDAAGETVTLDGPATRVVCLTGLCVDTLFVLGVKPVAALDALHKEDPYWGSNENEILPIGGSFFEPSLEDIARTEPDIVIGLGGVHDGLRPGLGSIAPLFIVNPVGVDGLVDHVLEIGALMGMADDAESATVEFTARLEAYASEVETRKSFMVVFGSDVNIGADTLCTPVVDAIGSAADYGLEFPGCVHGEFPIFSVEQLLSIDPDVIFVQTFGFGPTPPQPVSEQLADNAIWSELSAVQNQQVFEVSFPIWGTSRGIHGATVALDEAMPLIYPDVFAAPLP